jgi:hypothetical protein
MAAKPLALSIINKGTIYYDLNKSWWLHTTIHYNSMDKLWIYSIKMLSMVPLNVVDASDEDQSSSLSNSSGAVARPRRPPPCGDLRQLSDEWMSMGNHLGAPRGLYLWPWCAIGRALHEISHVQSSNNANSVSRLCSTKLSSTLVFIAFVENEDKIPKTTFVWFRTCMHSWHFGGHIS